AGTRPQSGNGPITGCRSPASSLATRDEQDHARCYRSRAGPHRDVHRFLLLDRELERTDLRLVSLLGVAEAAVGQTQGPQYDQDDRDDLIRRHELSSSGGIPSWHVSPARSPGFPAIPPGGRANSIIRGGVCETWPRARLHGESAPVPRAALTHGGSTP